MKSSAKHKVYAEKKECCQKRLLGRLTSDCQGYFMLYIHFCILGLIVRSSPMFEKRGCSNSSPEDGLEMR